MLQKMCILLSIGLILFACQSNDDFELDEPFELGFQETKINSNEDIKIGFDDILSDNRCPSDVVCVWEGNAEVNLSFTRGGQSETFRLNTQIEPSVAVLFGFNIELMGLKPPQSNENPPAKEDYVVSLVIKQAVNICDDNTDCRFMSADKRVYCAKADGDCVGQGECLKMPEACPDVWMPVCGCDGKTYGNACEAAAAGVNVNSDGECQPSYCWDNKMCDTGKYCYFSVCAQETGTCKDRPENCTTHIDPVCGCDGITYSNACVAALKGMSVDYKGECRDTHCDDGQPITCKMLPPVCGEFEILAHQNGCYVCVNPATCKPWGDAGCKSNFDCSENETCDPCGTSSCPFCDDCVPACVPKPEPTCDDLAKIDFGSCEMLLGWGIIKSECRPISGCSNLGYSLFETENQCIETCQK